jgi:hypothetical protein
MKIKVTFVLVLALAQAIHINDDAAAGGDSQPDFNFPAPDNSAQIAAQQAAQQAAADQRAAQLAAQQQAAQQAAQLAAQQAAAQKAAAEQAAAQQAAAQVSKYAVNIDLQNLPGPDVVILAGLWGLYQDLVAPSASLNLIYAANLNNADGSVNWRLVYQLVGPNWGVTYIAVQVVNRNGQWSHDHGFYTHTLNEVIYLWGLPANTSFGNLNVQGLLAAVLAKNPFAQISQSAIDEAVNAAKAEFQVTLEQALADKSAAEGQVSQLKAQVEGLNSQIQSLQVTIQSLQVTIQSNAAAANDNRRGWAQQQQAQQAQQQVQQQQAQQVVQPVQQAQAPARGATIGRGGNVQFPNAILNIGNALKRDE